MVEREVAKASFFAYVDTLGHFRNVSGWLGIDEREWWREGAVGVEGEARKRAWNDEAISVSAQWAKTSFWR